MTRTGPVLAVVLGSWGVLTPLAAQTRPIVAVEAVATKVWQRGPDPAAATFAGFVLGGEGWLRWGPASLHAGYVEGTVRSGAAHRTYVNGFGLLGIEWHGFLVAAGPHARAAVAPAGAERRVFWEIHGRYEAPILEPWVSGYAEGWGVVSGQVGGAGAVDAARGGAAGILVRPSGGNLGLRLAYAIDAVQLGGAGRETVETMTLAVGFWPW